MNADDIRGTYGCQSDHVVVSLRDRLDQAEQTLYAAEQARDLAYDQARALMTAEGREFLLGRVHANLNAAAAHCAAAAVRCLIRDDDEPDDADWLGRPKDPEIERLRALTVDECDGCGPDGILARYCPIHGLPRR